MRLLSAAKRPFEMTLNREFDQWRMTEFTGLMMPTLCLDVRTNTSRHGGYISVAGMRALWEMMPLGTRILVRPMSTWMRILLWARVLKNRNWKTVKWVEAGDEAHLHE